MHGFCNCSVGASNFFLHDPSKSNKTNNVSYVNGDHESTHFYELLPSCSSKNTSSNASKRPPAGGVVWWVFQLGDYDHCRRDVFGPYILVWRGRKKQQWIIPTRKNLIHTSFIRHSGKPSTRLKSKIIFSYMYIFSSNLPECWICSAAISHQKN